MRKDHGVCLFLFFFYGCSAGTGQMAGVELESVSGGLSQSEIGEMRDLSAQHLIRFHDQNPGTTTSKALVIKNTT